MAVVAWGWSGCQEAGNFWDEGDSHDLYYDVYT